MMKLSFIFTLHYIAHIKKWYRYILYILIITGAGLTLFVIFGLAFFCHPANFFWDMYDGTEHGECRPIHQLSIGSIVYSCWVLIADSVLGLVLPIVLLKDLQMDKRTKFSILCILGLSLK